MIQTTATVKRSGLGLRGYRRVVVKSTMEALNRTADEGQLEERAVIGRNFHVRDPRFIYRMVKRSPRGGDFATMDRLIARVRIEGPEDAVRGFNTQKATVLTRHEAGGTETGTHYAPTEWVRKTPQSIIAKEDYPSSLRLIGRRTADGYLRPVSRTTKTGQIQVLGKRRAFILYNRQNQPIAVFQRGDGTGGAYTDKGKKRRKGSRMITRRDEITVLWVFLNRPVTLKPKLQFHSTFRRVHAQRYRLNYEGFSAINMRKEAPR